MRSKWDVRLYLVWSVLGFFAVAPLVACEVIKIKVPTALWWIWVAGAAIFLLVLAYKLIVLTFAMIALYVSFFIGAFSRDKDEPDQGGEKK